MYISPTVRKSPVADSPLIMIMPKASGNSVPRSPMDPAHSILSNLMFMPAPRIEFKLRDIYPFRVVQATSIC